MQTEPVRKTFFFKLENIRTPNKPKVRQATKNGLTNQIRPKKYYLTTAASQKNFITFSAPSSFIDLNI